MAPFGGFKHDRLGPLVTVYMRIGWLLRSYISGEVGSFW